MSSGQAEPANGHGVRPKQEDAGSAEWAVWIATGVLVAGAYARHGLLVRSSELKDQGSLCTHPRAPLLSPRQVSGLYWLSTAVLCVLDPSLHSLQLLNLGAVVYDLSFELQRLYLLVSNRPLLMVIILGVALAVEWLLERYEEEDNAGGGQRGVHLRYAHTHGATRPRREAPHPLPAGGVARIGRSVGRVLLPGVMGVLIACVGWLLLSAVILHPTALVAPVVQYVERRVGGSSACASISDCLLITGSTFQAPPRPVAAPPAPRRPPRPSQLAQRP